ncbi:MAG: ATP-binding cassette domain-containing protein [Oscillibacter sp.]|jgi:molybdate transport system ATP-binding protein|nr:ATP-binding cassette domain-containing protein [Oscillibacter sp.]
MTLKADIRKRLGNFHLDVHLEAGSERLALLGASGCGKSVTLRCIAGILRPDEGHIELDGRVLYDSAAGIDLPPQRRKIGYLFQQYALFPNMTVRQNIAAAVGDKSLRAARAADLLSRFRLEDAAERRPCQLSGGQQQRAALARILASGPMAVLLDEPFSALDSYLKYQLELELSDLLEDFSGPVVWVSHDRGEVWRNCRWVCVLDSGRSAPAVTTEELFRSPGTQSAARLSGCKNYVPIRPAGDRVEIPLWGVTLSCGRPVPPDTAVIGIRSHRVRPAPEGAVNAIPCAVSRVIDDVFGVIVLLRPQAALPGAPLVRMELPREDWAPLADAGSLWASVLPEDILLLK